MTTPDGERKKKWVYGQNREEVHAAWITVLAEAKKGPISTAIPTLDKHLAYWLAEVVIEPNFAPLTISTYEGHTRLHIRPYLGGKRLDKLSVREIRTWINILRKTCQCCTQGKDAKRPPGKRRCCAKEGGECCEQFLSSGSVQRPQMLAERAVQCRH